MTSPESFSPGAPLARARYIMIGGFLGAGKTTAMAALAERLTRRGLRVGLITNDQGSELVDTATLRARGFASEEIPGGCFCCRFNSLVEASRRLDERTQPDVFLAEPVGSCTDLIATVSYPLRRIYGDYYSIAPLSVLVDPIRAERIFGLAAGPKFSEKVLYIYRKQLEEADLIVISKSDSVSPQRVKALRERLALEFPQAEIIAASVREGHDLEEWFATLETGEPGARSAMEVDYQAYAEGEALLGWLNATVELSATGAFDANAALETLAKEVRDRLDGAELAHLKMTFSPSSGLNDIAAINLVRSDFVPELSLRLEEPVEAGQLIINLRAEGDPAYLEVAVRDGLLELAEKTPGLTARLDHLEAFRPGKPQPTHRMAELPTA